MTDVKNRGSPLGISVLISGSGVGGLMTALECWRAGCEVRVLERAQANPTTGDSFTISPTALDIFRHWPELERRNAEIGVVPQVAYHRHTGERVAGPFPMNSIISDNIKDKNSKVMRWHIRPKFHTLLLDQLLKLGIKVEYGQEVVRYFEDEATGKAGVEVKSGEKYEADLVVAADGVHGKSWELVADNPVPAKSSGSAVFRTAFPLERVLRDPVVAERFFPDLNATPTMELWAGPKMQIWFSRNGDLFFWGIIHPDTGSAEESWSHKVSPEEVLEFTSTIPDFPDYANRAIAATPPDQLIDWKLMWRDPQPKWTSPSGRVVQLGDAAHTFLPSSGQGATQAMEDAISLAACLRRAGRAKEIPDATRVHNILRFERVSCLQALGVRNAANRDSSRKGQNTDKTMQVKLGKWILEHDPETYASENYDRALAWLNASGKPQGGEGFKNTNIPQGLEYQPWTIDRLMESAASGEKTIFDGNWD